MRATLRTVTLAGGVYGAGVVGLLVVTMDRVVLSGALGWPLALTVGLCSGFVGAAGGLRATLDPEAAARLQNRPVALLAVIVPPLLCLSVTTWYWLQTGTAAGGLLIAGVVTTVLSVLGTLALFSLSGSLYETRLLDDSEVTITLPQTVAGQWKVRLLPYARVIWAVGVVGWLALLALEGLQWGFAVFGLLGSAAVLDAPSEYTITDAGLRVDQHVRPWSDFEGFDFEADVLRIETAWGSSYRFPRESIEDEAAVREALSAVFVEKTEK